MFTETRKIELLKDVLETTNEGTLVEIERIVNKSKKQATIKKKNISIYDFVGILSKKESAAIKKAINEQCEIVDNNEWV